MSLFSRNNDLPGLHGTLRDCTPGGKGFKKLSPGDFAVIDAPDITLQEAQTLLDAKPNAIINLAQFTTGLIPNFGPQLLLDADILLVEELGAEFGACFRDGKRGRITEDGEVCVGTKVLGQGQVVEREKVESNFTIAQRNLIDHMEAYFGNTIQFIHSEGPLLLDGMGVPEVGINLRGRKVLVVSPSEDHRAKVKLLRNFIREYEPAIIGVGEAADSVVDMGYDLDIIIADPEQVQAETLRSGAKVILPATPEGRALGLERIQDLGVGAMTFPSAMNSSTDLALLLADYHEAQMIVQVGGAVELDDIFRDVPHATPSALLARIKAGRKVVDADAVIGLYTAPTGNGVAWMWALLGILVAAAVIVLIAGFGGDAAFADNLISTWNNLLSTITGWFS